MAITPPTGATVFAYQVGFGDCLLVRFRYANGRNRHVLIDFGTTKLPDAAGKTRMLDIANDIKDKCGADGLTAVVATHRHADHVSGFATGGSGSGEIIASLKPKVVMQPWTEHPDAAKDATGPAFAGPNTGGKGFAQSLLAMQDFAKLVTEHVNRKGIRWESQEIREQLSFIGEDGVKNLSAVRNLMAMGRAGKAKAEYLYHGAKTSLSAKLGVKVHVLGPPTVKQHDAVRKQNPRNDEEYWHLQLRALGTAMAAHKKDRLFPGVPVVSGGKLPASARWLAYRVRLAAEEQMLSLVRMLDDALNNTSLILLFEVGDKKLLFPGDAQWENWEYALSLEEDRALLEDVNLYKVGHHGSLNATPKTMWDLFRNRGKANKKGRLMSVLSTLPGKHGSEKNKSEVPRKTLLTALREDTHLDNTDELPAGALCTATEV